jgi:hypothetical protein
MQDASPKISTINVGDLWVYKSVHDFWMCEVCHVNINSTKIVYVVAPKHDKHFVGKTDTYANLRAAWTRVWTSVND